MIYELVQIQHFCGDDGVDVSIENDTFVARSPDHAQSDNEGRPAVRLFTIPMNAASAVNMSPPNPR